MATPFDESGAVDEAAARAARRAPARARLARARRRRHDRRVRRPSTDERARSSCCGRCVDEVGDEALLVCGTGTNDTRHSIELTKAAADAGADAALVVTPYYNKPNPAGHPRPLRGGRRGGPRAAADRSTTSPRGWSSTCRPELLGRAGRDRQRRRRQAGQRRRAAARSRAWRSSPATTTSSCGRSSSAARAASSSPRTSSAPQMREIWDAAAGRRPRPRARDRRRADARSTRRLAVTTNPIPLKAALEMLGLIPTDRLRLPLVARRRRAAGRGQGRRSRASASRSPARPTSKRVSN